MVLILIEGLNKKGALSAPFLFRFMDKVYYEFAVFNECCLDVVVAVEF